MVSQIPCTVDVKWCLHHQCWLLKASVESILPTFVIVWMRMMVMMMVRKIKHALTLQSAWPYSKCFVCGIPYNPHNIPITKLQFSSAFNRGWNEWMKRLISQGLHTIIEPCCESRHSDSRTWAPSFILCCPPWRNSEARGSSLNNSPETPFYQESFFIICNIGPPSPPLVNIINNWLCILLGTGNQTQRYKNRHRDR